MLICSSPQLFAACHVLLRLLMPRHSPYALLSLNSFVYLPIYSFSLSLELLCITFLQLLFYFALAKLFLLPFWKDLISLFISKSRLFPFLLNIKSVRVLNSSYSVFNELCMLSPAFFQPLTQLYILSKSLLNVCIAA